MLVSITNRTHPMELQVVAKALLDQYKIKCTKESHTRLTCEVPSEAYFNSLKQVVEFTTECQVELVTTAPIAAAKGL